MVRQILLRVDEKFFNKLKSDKIKVEDKYGIPLTWESYIKFLFNKSI